MSVTKLANVECRRADANSTKALKGKGDVERARRVGMVMVSSKESMKQPACSEREMLSLGNSISERVTGRGKTGRTTDQSARRGQNRYETTRLWPVPGSSRTPAE